MECNLFLSIIIPIYNGERYIERCLNSIWQQTLDESTYEVICVNDCSTDNTVDIITKVQKEHTNLRLLSNPINKRAGGSRNYGVKESKGKYIVFIDADDYFHQDSLRSAIDAVKKQNLDILVCDFARHPANKPNNDLVHRFKSEKIMSGKEFMITNGLPYAPWKYVFKKELMINNHCYFEENVSCEDVDWSHKIAFYARTMQYKPILLTHYILVSDSQTGSEYKNKATVFYRLFCGYRIMSLLNMCQTNEETDYIRRVADSTYKNGLLFYFALPTSPVEKRSMIVKYVIPYSSWKGLLGFASAHPYCYSLSSTLISPLFLVMLVIKRKLLGR